MRNARNLRWGRKPGEGSGHPRLRWLYRRPLKRRGPMWASAPTKTSYQLPRAAATPRSGALGAAFEEAPVAVTAGDSTGPREALMGHKRTTPTGPIGLNSFRVASPWDARRAAPWGPGAAAPGAFWGLFRGEKSPAGGSPAAMPERFRRPHRSRDSAVGAHRASVCLRCLSASAEQTRLRRVRADEGIGPY